MTHDLVKANLNLYAVIKNLEDLVAFDPEMKELSSSWNLSIQFSVWGGPRAYIDFRQGVCTVGRGRIRRPSIILFFTSPGHLNRMFDGAANPIPLRGFTKIGFLTKEFPKLTDRLTHFLKPTDELLRDRAYLEMNARLTMNTAAYAIPEIAAGDPTGITVASHMPPGTVVMKILPSFHTVNISFDHGTIKAGKGDAADPTAIMAMKNVKIANDFLNGRIDAFTAIASGDVTIRGIIPQLDAMSLLLDRIPAYLS